ncbi:hypothetical protein FGO68_gene4739 [Halteria grandinella]|uniref:Uncharacterized protein n=1 Tax=Halteria grandinella TaxID=5974 RepID=A0A8J8NYV7_HALGN|nr:hypothetical protein FGO68_gene4739 [Halteria grandinella]
MPALMVELICLQAKLNHLQTFHYQCSSNWSNNTFRLSLFTMCSQEERALFYMTGQSGAQNLTSLLIHQSHASH